MANEGVRLGKQWRQADTTITTQGIKSAVLWKMGHKEEVFKILEELRPLTSLVSSWYLNYLDAYLILLGVEPERLKSTCRWFDLQEELSESDFNHSDAILCRARARILYTNGRYSESLNWLELISKDSERTGTRMYVADAQVMQAICHYRLGDKEEARKHLCKALEFILAERAYSIILDKDEAGRELLEGLTFEPPLAEEINFLLELAKAPRDLDHGSSAMSQVVPKQPKTAGLSTREKEILSYLATHKTSIEIAEGLTVSANTIRFHIKSIYNKLDVHSRDEAIERARQLNLI
jgi:LuxR family maltose regulon positive regulatory protein